MSGLLLWRNARGNGGTEQLQREGKTRGTVVVLEDADIGMSRQCKKDFRRLLKHEEI